MDKLATGYYFQGMKLKFFGDVREFLQGDDGLIFSSKEGSYLFAHRNGSSVTVRTKDIGDSFEARIVVAGDDDCRIHEKLFDLARRYNPTVKGGTFLRSQRDLDLFNSQED